MARAAAKKETPEAAPEEPPFNAVVVVRDVDPNDGGVGTRIILSGDVKGTEVETILKLGLKGWQQQIGV